jgi:hypothetical protein
MSRAVHRSVFLLWSEIADEHEPDVVLETLLGCYSSRALAEAEKARELGREHSENATITVDEYRVGQSEWTEGFETWS